MQPTYVMRAVWALVLLSAACAPAPAETPPDTQDPALAARTTAAAATLAAVQAESTRQQETRTAMENELATRAYEATREAELQAEREAQQATAAARATAEEQAIVDQFASRVQELFDEGIVNQVEGSYYTLSDFDQSWAQLNWYQWWPTGHSPTNFVLSADLAWASASETADWWNSGCGFLMHFEDGQNHYLVQLALDGRLYFLRLYNDRWTILAQPFVGSVEIPRGEASVMIVVEDDWFTFFVNGDRIHTRQDTALPRGELFYTLVSGTNKDFGTRCQMRNVELWEFD